MSEPDVFALILAGGSGTRFWPASRRLRPKQLLPLGPSAPQTLISATVARLEGLVSAENIWVSTGTHLVDKTRQELSALPSEAFLAEPCAKNTAPCIAWATALLAEHSPDAVMVVLPSDQHAQDDAEFRQTLRRAIVRARQGSITTVGIVPSRPETGYGYLKRGEVIAGAEAAYRVEGFFEKPDLSTAERYLKDGNFYWNAGIFVFRVRDMMHALATHLPALHALLPQLVEAGPAHEPAGQQAALRFFEQCDSISIDYGVMEKEEELSTVPGDFGWSDLGSWESAWELSPKDQQGNAAPEGSILVGARNNLVSDLRSDKGGSRVISLLGVEDLCVVQTDDALLIMPRERSQDVREVVAELKQGQRDELI